VEAAALITALSNLGGAGVLAGAIFFLHLQALQAFRSEMKAERDSHDRHIGRLLAGLDAVRHEVAGLKATLEARPLRIYRPDDEPA
jgi:hypothetical protein